MSPRRLSLGAPLLLLPLLLPLLLLLVGACVGAAAERAARTTYTAASIEFLPRGVDNSVPVSRATARAVMLGNVARADALVGRAASAGAQIVVLPEFGLTDDDFPNVRDAIAPYAETLPPVWRALCHAAAPDSARPVIEALACVARKHRVTLVANMPTAVPCAGAADCPANGQFQYNTQLAFSSTGDLLQYYYKIHLFPDEAQFYDTPVDKRYASFVADFGVRFGMFTCFDIFFPTPTEPLLAEGVRDFTFVTDFENNGMWPLLSAVEMQQAWVLNARANLIAANIGRGFYDSGSGIYAANGDPLAMVFHDQRGDDGSTVLVANVTTTLAAAPARVVVRPHDAPAPRAAPLPSHARRGRDAADSVTFKLAPFVIDAAASNGSLTVAAPGVSCTLTWAASAPNATTYALYAGAGGYFSGSLQATLCEVMQCVDDNAGGAANCTAFTTAADAAFSVLELDARASAPSTPAPEVLAVLGVQHGQLLPASAWSVLAVDAATTRLSLASVQSVSNAALMLVTSP